MKKDRFYSKYVSTHYQYIAPATIAGFRKRYSVWKSYLARFVPENKNSAILEIGAGVGHNLYALRELGYTNVTGTDYSQECVDICTQNGLSAQVVTPEKEEQFYIAHKQSFDMVILYDVLEHYTPEKGEELLRQIRTMLLPRGFLIISLPNASHPLSNSLFFADVTHKFIYTMSSLSQLLRSAGYSDHSFFQMNSFSLYDDNIFMRFIKTGVIPIIAFLGESFWRALALSQGIILGECKPTLIAVVRR